MVQYRDMSALIAVLAACCSLLLASAAENLSEDPSPKIGSKGYTHTWPKMEFGWRIVVGTVMAFCGASFGSVGGGAAGIFIPMLTLVIGFDAKSSPAISKCMIMGVAISTLYYNIRRRHPTLDMPIIDYDLALLFQPVLVLGISIGVTLNVILADWMITVLLITLCLVTSVMSFWKGTKKWKQETIQKELDKNTTANESHNQSLPGGSKKQTKVSIMQNVHWKKLTIIVCVWIIILALQIIKSHTSNCSPMYWIVNLLQIPVTVAASGYEAVKLYKGKSVIASRDEKGTHIAPRQLVFYCFMGIIAGAIGGMVGLGGASILGPVFLEMGVPPQVSSATATFAVLFSSSMSVVEYYLLHRFPIPYSMYFVVVSTIAAIMGQHFVKRLVSKLGRESPIIFILAFTFLVSALLIGSEGIVDMIHKIKNHSYMGLESLCLNSP